MPQISVIIPFQRVDEMLRQAVESVKNQSFLDYEIILVDDSPCVAREYPAYFSQCKVEVGPKAGISRALNRGCDLAKAPYIARLDSDDLMHPERLKLQWEYMQSHPDVGAVGTYIKTFGWSFESWRYATKSQVVIAGMCFRNEIAHPSVMIRAEALEGFTGPYRSEYDGLEDWDLWERISRNWDLANLPGYLTFHRLHGQQYSRLFSDIRVRAADVRQRFFQRVRIPVLVGGSLGFPKERNNTKVISLGGLLAFGLQAVVSRIVRAASRRFSATKSRRTGVEVAR